MASEMRIDSARGKQWCDAVEKINNEVQKIMNDVAQIINDLGSSDEGGSIGQKLVKAAAGYVQKFGQMVEQFVNVVQTISAQIGRVVDFVGNVMSTIATVAKIVAVFVA